MRKNPSQISGRAVLLPGYGATAQQPLLVELSRALRRIGLKAHRRSVSKVGQRPSPGLVAETEALSKICARTPESNRLVLIGRSFGGRVCTLYAAKNPPSALVVIGYPIRPPGKRRLLDEAALAQIRCPTLIVQGARDELGPLKVLRKVIAANKAIELRVIPGAGHQIGSKRLTSEIIALVVEWLSAFAAPSG